MTKIGPTFTAEITAAGLAGLPCSWGDDGTYVIGQLTAAQQATFLQVLAAHDPTKQLVPQSVTALQARRALRAAGLYNAALAAVQSAAASDPDVQDSWDFADPWVRNASWIAELGPGLGLTSAQVDALFVQASGL